MQCVQTLLEGFAPRHDSPFLDRNPARRSINVGDVFNGGLQIVAVVSKVLLYFEANTDSTRFGRYSSRQPACVLPASW